MRNERYIGTKNILAYKKQLFRVLSSEKHRMPRTKFNNIFSMYEIIFRVLKTKIKKCFSI